jgi:hypothetical protein
MNDLHSNKPDAGKWLSNEELSDIADGLLFEDRLLLRLEHLYQTCGQTNGLEMFDLINARLEAIQKGFDKEIRDSSRGEDRVVRFPYELLPDGTEKMMTMKDMRETTGFPIITYFPKYFNKAETSHISWVSVEWVKNEVLTFKAKKVLAEARGLLLSIAPPVTTSTEPKEIYISDENIEPIYNALAPYFREQETNLKQLLEGKAIKGKVRFNESAKVLCNTFNTLHEAGKIGATIEQIKAWLCRYFQVSRKPYDLSEGNTLNRYFQEKIEMNGQILLPTIKGLINFDKP